MNALLSDPCCVALIVAIAAAIWTQFLAGQRKAVDL